MVTNAKRIVLHHSQSRVIMIQEVDAKENVVSLQKNSRSEKTQNFTVTALNLSNSFSELAQVVKGISQQLLDNYNHCF